MKAGELRRLLADCDPEAEVLVCPDDVSHVACYIVTEVDPNSEENPHVLLSTVKP